MSPMLRRRVDLRWLLVGLVWLGLTLSGAAHHALFHVHAHEDPCCPADDGEHASAPDDHGEHACALCFLVGTEAPSVETPIGGVRGAARGADARPDEVVLEGRRSRASGRGPPRGA